MKAFVYILVGAAAGLLGAALSIYLFGLLVESLGLVMYRSEADQQRNFNIALLLVALFPCNELTRAFASAAALISRAIAKVGFPNTRP